MQKFLKSTLFLFISGSLWLIATSFEPAKEKDAFYAFLIVKEDNTLHNITVSHISDKIYFAGEKKCKKSSAAFIREAKAAYAAFLTKEFPRKFPDGVFADQVIIDTKDVNGNALITEKDVKKHIAERMKRMSAYLVPVSINTFTYSCNP